MRTRIVVAVGAVLLTAGCGGAPDAFEDRASLPTCERQDLALDGDVPAEAQACLDAGRTTGVGAELEVRRLTTEGDPITTWYRVLPGQSGYELFTDGTEDAFGAGTWTTSECPGAVTVRDLGESCTESTLD